MPADAPHPLPRPRRWSRRLLVFLLVFLPIAAIATFPTGPSPAELADSYRYVDYSKPESGPWIAWMPADTPAPRSRIERSFFDYAFVWQSSQEPGAAAPNADAYGLCVVAVGFPMRTALSTFRWKQRPPTEPQGEPLIPIPQPGLSGWIDRFTLKRPLLPAFLIQLLVVALVLNLVWAGAVRIFRLQHRAPAA